MNKRKYTKIYKNMLDNVDINEEQVEYLINLYSDEDCIVGIHNSEFVEPESFFEDGLYNYNDLNMKKEDLSNTVYYNDLLPPLLMYPSGGNTRGGTAILLKIPKDVFEKKQGIFEDLNDNMYGIPPQFIVGAFYEGKILENEKYDRVYSSRRGGKVS